MTVVLLETLRTTEQEKSTFRFQDPECVLRADRSADVIRVLEDVESFLDRGYWAAGFLSYEAGYSFLPNMPEVEDPSFPLIWFGIFKTPLTDQQPLQEAAPEVKELFLNLNREQYKRRIDSIKRYIEEGQSYQVNFTMRYRGKFQGSSRALYRQLREKQRVSYAAYIETEDWSIISLSPELFFRKRERDIWLRPMKGTARRGKTLEEDRRLARELEASEKERAENLMIVDLLRNDIGKVCEPGSVRVTAPLQVERYETVFQMTSSIEGKLRNGVKTSDVLRATFPSGSVTGAPKLRTMQIIRELEREPRRIYTGAIGVLHASEAVFSVAIRTAIIDHGSGMIEMGVGSGILYEADALREYQECELKGRFLSDPVVEFELLETMLWEPKTGVRNLQLHMKRLSDSAEYFMIPFQRKEIESSLIRLDHSRSKRVRLLLDRSGGIKIVVSDLEPLLDPRVRFAAGSVKSSDIFLYHKTTNRALQNQELQSAREEGFFDVLFTNERNEVTEGAISNVLIQKGNTYYTPPVECGLLPGTYRQYLLQSANLSIVERVLSKEDVVEADEIYLTNAVRGLIKVHLQSS